MNCHDCYVRPGSISYRNVVHVTTYDIGGSIKRCFVVGVRVFYLRTRSLPLLLIAVFHLECEDTAECVVGDFCKRRCRTKDVADAPCRGLKSKVRHPVLVTLVV